MTLDIPFGSQQNARMKRLFLQLRWPSFRSLEIEAMKFIRMWLSVLLCAPALVGSATATSIPMVEPRILVCLAYESKSAALTKSTETSLANAISLAKKSAADLSSIKAGLSLPPLDENSDSWTRPHFRVSWACAGPLTKSSDMAFAGSS
jgi:hypothetical protein